MEKHIRKSAVDLTDLAIGIVVLGIVVSIGSLVLVTMRDSRLTDLTGITTGNETITPGYTTGTTVANQWVSGLSFLNNATADSVGEVIDVTNYTSSIDNGVLTITLDSASGYANESVNATYNWYNISEAQWALPNDAAIGLGEYGNWFKIIVIVGVAAIVLSLIFLAFGRRDGVDAGGSY